MPKLIRPIAAKKKPVPEKPLVERVADAADSEAIFARDLIRFPELLAKHKLPEHVSHTTAFAADQYNRDEFDKLVRKYTKRERDEYAESV